MPSAMFRGRRTNERPDPSTVEPFDWKNPDWGGYDVDAGMYYMNDPSHGKLWVGRDTYLEKIQQDYAAYQIRNGLYDARDLDEEFGPMRGPRGRSGSVPMPADLSSLVPAERDYSGITGKEQAVPRTPGSRGVGTPAGYTLASPNRSLISGGAPRFAFRR